MLSKGQQQHLTQSSWFLAVDSHEGILSFIASSSTKSTHLATYSTYSLYAGIIDLFGSSIIVHPF
uniref:Uncharacterized protein n=1 Tax=Megaselia scalaris TaxID=36166 RepID=T1GHW8_MEGSC